MKSIHHGHHTMSQSELITPKEAAKILRMSEIWLAKQRALGKGLSYVQYGRRIFYIKQEVFDFIQKSKKV